MTTKAVYTPDNWDIYESQNWSLALLINSEWLQLMLAVGFLSALCKTVHKVCLINRFADELSMVGTGWMMRKSENLPDTFP